MFKPRSRIDRVCKFFELSAERFPLHAAICKGDLNKARGLVDSSPSLLEEEDAQFGAPLHVAIFCDNLEAVEMLLNAGADVLARSSGTDDEANALTVAARENKQSILRQLWQYRKLGEDAEDYDALQYCFIESAAWGQVDSIANLIDWWDGWTMQTKVLALNRAAQRWKIYVVELLVSKIKFDPKVLDEALALALDYKVLLGSTNEVRVDYEGVDYFELQQLIKLLLHAGANINTTHFGIPLVIFTALKVNLIGALSVLLQNGADANTADGQGRTALHHLGCAIPLRQGSLSCRIHEAGIRLLLGHKASICQQDTYGVTPIHKAAYGTNLRVFLLELFSVPDQAQRDDVARTTNLYGSTLLHYAAAGAKLDIIEYLVSQGLDVNHANSNGWTLLMCALVPTSEGPSDSNGPKGLSDAIQAAQLLLSHGADPLITTKEGWTPLHCISLYISLGQNEQASAAIARFVSLGADINACAIFLTDTGQRNPKPPSYYWGYQLQEMIMEPARFGIAFVRSKYTPLHFAAAKGSVDMVRALLEHGADPSCRDADGNSAAKIATHSWNLHRRPEVRDEIVKLLYRYAT
jgi:ankyrin repeat protein